ncbi:alpha/beta fold hydrolase [Kushneria phyllosphaerae]|uniref:Lipase 1 n=1 Tax=Kushneria phyllosphaerae TaxID=2100822 RepID=A0A2R8CL87_9GAMM|nr:alpha/beta hydrolase [Kushneria phyllosphaerae]SPJ33524.1 Lipase 1 [Kushneria phyllosphaerae]
MRSLLLIPLLASLTLPAMAGDNTPDDAPVYGPRLEGFDYPWSLHRFELDSQQQSLEMMYMDVAPQGKSNGETVVLMHGKNFCAATWESTIKALTQKGYRVIAPDQIGFCKSSKPQHYQYSLHQLAANTNALLSHIGIERATIMGHSMGGMLATRYTLMYPEATHQLVLVDPIGLEDWKAKGVPWQSIDDWYESGKKASAEKMRTYQKETYYAGQWQPEYDRWVEMQAGMYRGEGRDINAWSQALTYDMVFTQPIVYEFGDLKVPTLLIVGDKDNTAVGKGLASKEIQKTLGHYDELGPKIAEQIPASTYVHFEDLGHSPQVQAPERFHAALLKWLNQGH